MVQFSKFTNFIVHGSNVYDKSYNNDYLLCIIRNRNVCKSPGTGNNYNYTCYSGNGKY